MSSPLIIVSGKNGQLGRELQALASLHPQFDFYFYSKDELDISDFTLVEESFQKHQPTYFINCAAYTAVDKAETDKENAYKINAEAVGNIAMLCKEYKTQLIHISTDYVFDGTANKPYTEEDKTCPVNYYGYTKWMGEELALKNNFETTIIRASWLYSSYGNNFVKTMLRLMNERKELNVVNDQIGCPTYAKDLADAVMKIVCSFQFSVFSWQWAAGSEQLTRNEKLETRNVFHFSNDGAITWYDFACAIRDIKKFSCEIHPVPTLAYPTPAKRPAYSVLSKEKIIKAFNIDLKNWRESLKECLEKIKQVL